MGRKRISIKKISDERTRQVTFSKRKFGLMKKCFELSKLTNTKIGLLIFTPNNKLYQFASEEMDEILYQYSQYEQASESVTNLELMKEEAGEVVEQEQVGVGLEQQQFMMQRPLGWEYGMPVQWMPMEMPASSSTAYQQQK